LPGRTVARRANPTQSCNWNPKGILGTDGRTVIRSASYAAITDASYVRSSGTGVFIFGRGIRQYFTVKTAGEPILIRLDKSNQERILSEFQRLSGRKVTAESTGHQLPLSPHFSQPAPSA
jgi:hypothetical protein